MSSRFFHATLIAVTCLLTACGAQNEQVKSVWSGNVLAQEFNGMNLTTTLGIMKDEAPEAMVINGQQMMVSTRQIQAMFVNWGDNLGDEKGAYLGFNLPGANELGPIVISVHGSDDAIWSFKGVVTFSQGDFSSISVSAESNFCGPFSARPGLTCGTREHEVHYQQIATFIHWLTTVSSATVFAGETSTIFQIETVPSDITFAVDQVQREARVIAATPRSARQSTWDAYAEHFGIERQKDIVLLGWSFEQNGERVIWQP